jgi:peptidoglycan/LPS O-acetylase OafA/YrhL
LLSFIWIAGLRLGLSSGKDKTALRDIGIIFGCHIALGVLIQFGFRLRHHAVSLFFSHDAIDYAMQSVTLLCVYLIFKHIVIIPRPSPHRSKFLRLLGDISYPLYLLHALVYTMLARCGFRMPVVFYLSAVLFSALVYWLLDWYSQRRHQQMGTA